MKKSSKGQELLDSMTDMPIRETKCKSSKGVNPTWKKRKESYFGQTLHHEERATLAESINIKKENRIMELKKDATFIKLQEKFHMDADIDTWIKDLEMKEKLSTGRQLNALIKLTETDKVDSDNSIDMHMSSDEDSPHNFDMSPNKGPNGRPNHFELYETQKT